tara:strand:+ start:53 stop:913 length:861 start_codon:yes stop_codon:yes gene_type:complete
MNYIESYLDNFWTINENSPLAEGKVSKKGGVIKEGDMILAIPFDATGQHKGKKEIGYGHVITSSDRKNGFLAVDSSGKRYRIPYSEDVKLTQKQTKDIARADIITREPIARRKIAKAGGNFDEFSSQKKMLALDYELNVGEDKEGNSGIDAFPKFFEGLITNNPSLALKEYKRFTGGKEMTTRNKTTKNLLMNMFNLEQPPTQAKRKEPKEIEVEVSEAEPPKSFKQAFAEARANKDAEFTYSGSRYNTRLKGETPQQYAAFLGKEMPVRVARKGGMVIKNYKERT